MTRLLVRCGLLLGTFVFAVAIYAIAVRPWLLSWGATAEETRMPLPGDDIVADAGTQATRAITIDAPIDRVWPWLAQIGQDRGGFYSYARLENLVGCRMPDPQRLVPEYEQWQLGDKLWMYPPDRAGGIGFATLRTFEPGRALGFATRMAGTTLAEPENGSWSFVLRSTDDGAATRLVIRDRGTADRSLGARIFDRAVFEPMHFVMERRMMRGLAAVATHRHVSATLDDLQIGIWVLAFVAIGAAKILVLVRRDWRRPLVGFAAALAVFQIVTLVQPNVVVGALLVGGVGAILWWPMREPHRPRAIAA